jgi:type IV secretory pathway VirB4 component
MSKREKVRLLRVPRHKMTTAQCASLYPLQSDPAISREGPLLGVVWPSGAAWHFDPFRLYRNGTIDNANMMIFGEPGSGKSAAVKCLLARHIGLYATNGIGRQAFIVDPKREYEGLADALGLTRLELRPGGSNPINPLGIATGSKETAAEVLQRWSRLSSALLNSVSEAGLCREEDAALGWALESLVQSRNASSVSLIELAQRLQSPDDAMVARSGTSRERLAATCRSLWLLADKLVRRDLAGMFDGAVPLSGVSAASNGIVLDVSSVFSDDAVLRLVMIAAISVLEACYADHAVADELVPRRFFVIDECWSMLGSETAARFLQENWKLARARGLCNIAVCHRIADLGAQSDSELATSKIAQGLISDAQTQVLFRVSPVASDATRQVLQLSQPETEAMTNLPRGVALWRVRGHSAFVRHLRSRHEQQFTDTDSRLAG